MNLPLDTTSPTPLFVQIIESVRWRIAVGELKVGDALPPARSASSSWGVNRHTIGRAYRELLQAGLVQRDGRSFRIARAPTRGTSRNFPDSETFIKQLIRESNAHGLTIVELIDHLRVHAGLTTGGIHPVIVECTQDQCDDLQRTIRDASGLALETLLLDDANDLPDGPIIGTRFHQEEMLRRWPERSGDMHFVAATLDPAIGAIARHLTGEATPDRVQLIVGNDRIAGTNLASDLESTLGAGCQVNLTVLSEESGNIRQLVGETPALLTPLVWRDTPQAVRALPNTVRLRYAITPDDLARLTRLFEWLAPDHASSISDPTRFARSKGEPQVCDSCHHKP